MSRSGGARPGGDLTGREAARKSLHVAVGGLAFLIRFGGPWWSALCAVAAVLFNLLLLPRFGGRRLWRPAETERGGSAGMVLYPVAVLLLILAFHRRLEIAAAVWGILAFGDGAASLFGKAFGRKRLPWNPAKSWIGSGAFLLFGTAGSTLLLLWTAPGSYGPGFALTVCALTTLLAAGLESWRLGLDDNLGVPLVSGLGLFCLVLTQERWTILLEPAFASGAGIGAVVNFGFAALARAIGGLTRAGAVAGFLVGWLVWVGLGVAGWSLLFTFFATGTSCTWFGYRRKEAAGLAERRGGRRGPGQVLANGGVAAAAAFFALTTPHAPVFVLAFAGALATATADTASSEIGQLLGRRPVLLTTLRPVPPGTNGAVSGVGTTAGVLASIPIGLLGVLLGIYPPAGAAVVVAAAFLGTLADSLAGAILERRGLLDNEAVNFLATLVGALTAAALGRLM